MVYRCKGICIKRKLGDKIQLKEAAPLNNVWQQARSKNSAEKQDAFDSLSLLFVLFEYTLDIKADESCDPLENLDELVLSSGTKKKAKPVTVEKFDKPYYLPPRKTQTEPENGNAPKIIEP